MSARRSGPQLDPDRRRRLLEATLRVVAERGVEGVTHRAVAKAAGVPLGSTTYYFESKDDLLAGAIELARERNFATQRRTFARMIEEGADLPRALATWVEEQAGGLRSQLVLDYRLYLAALNRPALRGESARWLEGITDLIREHTDAETARVLGYLLDGILIQAVMHDTIVLAADVEPVFRRLITS
ncbi:TetR/AcrR family transcriptional regulator [Capillimicrobium parvum]|uniref:HTH-type transcriptional regulator RcdA n=1 Tax=Capillimicrobium parvum TaxID=2884022 RepID=A0A9E7C0Q1_9ACTN|nr:TetR family transcriptional regulator [Capillimicrobium parvum]UGS35623.1 HTH-type transcriptional regulator RcdA [Capillimicrobium parvum]